MAGHGSADSLRALLLWAPELIDTKTNDGTTIEALAAENKIDFAPIRLAVQIQTYPARIKANEAIGKNY